jgi:hypothetical protein
LIGPEARTTLAENADLLDMPLAGAEDFARGAGFVAGKLHERGVAREVELAEAQRAAVRERADGPDAAARRAAFEAGWDEGVAEARAFRDPDTRR